MATQSGLDQFLAAIEEETNQHQEDTRRQTRLFVASELEKAEDEVLQESYRMIQTRAAEIRKEQGRKLSQSMAENDRLFLGRREEIMNEIVQKTAARLSTFTQSADYAEWLKRSAERIGAQFQAGGFRLFARQEDLKYREMLLAASGAADLAADGSVRLGGLRAENEKHTLCLDDTLDARLEEEKEQLRRNVLPMEG